MNVQSGPTDGREIFISYRGLITTLRPTGRMTFVALLIIS